MIPDKIRVDDIQFALRDLQIRGRHPKPFRRRRSGRPIRSSPILRRLAAIRATPCELLLLVLGRQQRTERRSEHPGGRRFTSKLDTGDLSWSSTGACRATPASSSTTSTRCRSDCGTSSAGCRPNDERRHIGAARGGRRSGEAADRHGGAGTAVRAVLRLQRRGGGRHLQPVRAAAVSGTRLRGRACSVPARFCGCSAPTPTTTSWPRRGRTPGRRGPPRSEDDDARQTTADGAVR